VPGDDFLYFYSKIEIKDNQTADFPNLENQLYLVLIQVLSNLLTNKLLIQCMSFVSESMEHTNHTSKGPSVTTILRNISDDKALVLFNSIAMSSGNDKYLPIKEMNLSTKQYYTRVSGLLGAGLIKRDKGRYYLTLLGKVVYESQKTIGITLSYYWKLKAIESLEAFASDIPAGEFSQLITALIDNHQIKDIIIKPIYASSVECDSKIRPSTPVMAQTLST
jgi:hypothetical protein